MNDELCEYLAWDSDFFGKRIARVKVKKLSQDNLHAIRSWADLHQIECLYFLANADDAATITLAEEQGFRLRDIRVTLEMSLPVSSREAAPDSLIIRAFQDKDIETLREISRTAFIQSRFLSDPNIPKDLASSLYDVWIYNSCMKGFADRVIVAELHGTVLGFVTVKIHKSEQFGSIELVSVARQARGKQIATHLVNKALSIFEENGLKSASVVTQGSNISALRLYQKNGFFIQTVELWFHLWISQ
jgi:dTDP-4-amino-4,6-dideoxy-D-galactose acyltransferase